jgi:nifR3 family TIM-barrel protein
MHIHDLARPLAIGPVTVANRVFLAPMSGVSDRPFRDIAARFGAGMVVSEMVAGEQLATGNAEARLRAERGTAALHVIQLAGREAHWMAEGARAATAAGADVIDINMGCPARKVTGGWSGSALMRDLDHALTLIEATVGATTVPVTLKMRLGWDDANRSAPALARRAEAAGVRMVTVHGRTRCQFYAGAADWAAIAEVKAVVGIPVVANGDLADARQLPRMLALTGADGVMIGRGAYGRPWLPGHLAAAAAGAGPAPPTGAALLDLVASHYEAILAHYGAAVGVKAARKHLGWYMDGEGVAAPLRHAVMTEANPAAVMRLLPAAFLAGAERRAA